MDRKIKIAVLVSGGGTNLQALIDAQNAGIIVSGEIAAVISSKAGVYALERAEKAGIPGFAVPRKECADLSEFENKVIEILEKFGIEVIVLAGFLSVLSEDFTKKYSGRIINVHPALIPSFCGKGFYGLKVHEEALKKGVKVSGATVHLVNEICDGGEILAQKAVQVKDGDTPETLQRRIMEQAEWKLLPEATEKLCRRILNEKKPDMPEIALRKWEISDKDQLAELCDNIDRKFLSDGLPSPYTVDDAIEWLNGTVLPEEGNNGIWRAIVYDGRIIGSVSVAKRKGLNRNTGVIGYFLHPDFYGRGIMTRAVKTICKEAFKELQLIRIEGSAFEPNIASRRVLEKAGFELEGILRDAIVKNGKHYNEYIYGLTEG